MSITPIYELSLSWLLGIVIGSQLFAYEVTNAPTYYTVIGFVMMAGLLSLFYFGRMAWAFVGLVGVLHASFIIASPLAGVLWGICVIAAGLYGKALGEMGLEDFFQHQQTRLPSMSLAAALNLVLILVFAILVAFVWDALPTSAELLRYIPLRGLGV